MQPLTRHTPLDEGPGVRALPDGRWEAPSSRSRPLGSSRPVARRARRRGLRFAAAASIAVGGYIHLCLYRNGFRAIPKIGVGFLLQVLTSAFVAVALLFGRERLLHLGRKVVRSSVAVWLLGLSLSLGTLAAFTVTRTPVGLFGFREQGLQPAPQALIALVAELTATVLLLAALVLDHYRPLPVPLVATTGSTLPSNGPGLRGWDEGDGPAAA